MVQPVARTEVGFVNIPTLIKIKETAGREQDRIDIKHLRMRLEDNAGIGNYPPSP
jgi:hypothetical protein